MGVSWVDFSCGIIVSLVLLHLVYSSEAEIVTVDVQTANDLMIKSGYAYIDVRTVEEYKNGHVEADKIFNIPYMFNTPEGRVKNPQFLTEVLAACNNEDKILVGCQSGVRSLSATADLQNNGFEDVSNVGGGYLAWVKNELPIKTPKEDLACSKNELSIGKPKEDLSCVKNGLPNENSKEEL